MKHRTGIAQREHLASSQEVAGETPAPRSHPWAVTDEQLAAREAALLAAFEDVKRRFLVTGMPYEIVRLRLAAHGFDAAALRRLRELLEARAAHG